MILEKYSRDTGRFWQVSFLYAKMGNKTSRDRFSVYREKQDEEGIRRRKDFYKMKNYEDKIYSLGETVTGQTQAMSQAVQKTLENNGGVGIMTGSYDQNLSILSVNNLLLHSTGYTFDTFMEQTKGSLRNFFYDEEDILERDRFLKLH